MTSLTKTFLSRTALWALPLLLAACQAPGDQPTSANAVRASSLIPSRGRYSPPDRPAAPAMPGNMPTAKELSADPARFTGMTGPDVTGLLGAPSYQRHEADAEIWQYYGPSSACVLDLFIYPDQGVMRVAHAELRSRGGGASAATDCLGQIVDGKRG